MLTRTSAFAVFIRLPICLLIVSFLGVGLFAKRGLVDLKRMERETNELAGQLKTVKLERERLQRRLESFQSNPEERERVVREVLGYVKPHEKIIEF